MNKKKWHITIGQLKASATLGRSTKICLSLVLWRKRRRKREKCYITSEAVLAHLTPRQSLVRKKSSQTFCAEFYFASPPPNIFCLDAKKKNTQALDWRFGNGLSGKVNKKGLNKKKKKSGRDTSSQPAHLGERGGGWAVNDVSRCRSEVKEVI